MKKFARKTQHLSGENEPVDIYERYQRAQSLMQGAYGTKKLVFNTTVVPYWIENTEHFWYAKETSIGLSYLLFDARNKTHSPAFNHQLLADSLSDQLGKPIDVNNLPLADADIALNPRSVEFTADGRRWKYDESSQSCQELASVPINELISPNGAKAVFVLEHNIWLRDIATNKTSALTTDGTEFCSYGGVPTALGNRLWPVLDIVWSPDSTQILTHLIDTREVRKGMPLVVHAPTDGGVRADITRPDRRVSCAGDTSIEEWQFLTININSATIQKIDYQPCPVNYPLYKGYFAAGRGWWGGDSRNVYLIYQDTDYRNTYLVKSDSFSGDTAILFGENPEVDATIIPATHMRTLVKPLPETNEVIWYSERNGWAHLYLYCLETGVLKKQITEGEWIVRNVLYVNAAERKVLVQTAGRITDRNPYYKDICWVDIDTGEISVLVSSDHEYIVVNKSTMAFMMNERASGVSHSGRYLVTTRSRVDDIPVSFLIDTQEKEMFLLEEADISGLPESWQWPEPVMVKGADNETDIYGVVFRPSYYCNDQSYPVLDLSFAFCEPVGSFSNSEVDNFHYLPSMAYAELGFIVVRFNHRGDGLRRGAGLRNRDFYDYKDSSLPIHNKADCVAAIKQLCKKYPSLDINRVGVADYISMPAALSGMLVYPGFYKVGVSVNPMVGGGLYPVNLGRPQEFPSYTEFAKNLSGKLFLIHGMLDDALPVSATFQIVEALQKENKSFDMLLLPNGGHDKSDYTLRRIWDYLVTHLLGVEPPKDFDLIFSSISSLDG